jgi:UDP-N-acetyl-D-mannosaminuronic acid transferase (WecB/TagA/CpsF family)
MVAHGGLMVAPSAPGLKDLPDKKNYRDALLGADMIITDSGFMVLMWNLLQRDCVAKQSGLAYLRELLQRPVIRKGGRTFWVMPTETSSARNIGWLRDQGVSVSPEDVYIAPVYESEIEDFALLERIRGRHPRHIVIAIGGGTQERLGLYIKQQLDYSPSIHCIGAAIAFLSGDQVHIPVWSDKLYLGWLFRCLWQPRLYCARYWHAIGLAGLMIRYRQQMPGRES